MNPKLTLLFVEHFLAKLFNLRNPLCIALILMGVITASSELYATANCGYVESFEYTVTDAGSGNSTYEFTFTISSNSSSQRGSWMTITCPGGANFMTDECRLSKTDGSDSTHIESYTVPTCTDTPVLTWTAKTGNDCTGQGNCICSAPDAGSISGDSEVCEGSTVDLSTTTANGTIQWYLDGDPISGGTTNDLNNSNPGAAGSHTYSVVVTNGCGDTAEDTWNVTVNALPTQFTVDGGGAYCSGGSGVDVTLSGSESGVNYQLKVNGGDTGSPIGGTGGVINFSNQTTAGTYTVEAENATTGCMETMLSSALVTIDPPAVAPLESELSASKSPPPAPIFATFTCSTMPAPDFYEFEYRESGTPGWTDTGGEVAVNQVKDILVDGGKDYDMRVRVRNNNTCPASDWTVKLAALLPVELVYFRNQLHGKEVLLTWQTATEVNNKQFIIERSADGRAFMPIGEIQGSGTINIQQSYQFTDNNPLSGINYYRLKQMDFDESFAYSQIITAELNGEFRNRLLANPVSDELTIYFDESLIEEGGSVSVYDSFGKLVKTTIVAPESSKVSIPVSNMVAGHYYVEIRGENSSETLQWVKM